MLNIKLDTNDALVQLEALSLPEKKRRAILRDMGRKSRNLAIDRVKEGKNRDGRKWKQPKQKAIFKKINQKKRTYIKTSGSHTVIGYKSGGRGYAGAIAKAHARGLEEKFTVVQSIKNLKKKSLPAYNSTATRAQAKRLLSLGYKMWDKDKKAYKKVSQAKIMSKLTFGQAGLIINLLKEEEKERKKTEWTIKRPVRELLGNTVNEQNKIRIAELERKMFLKQKS
ncbi:hypothetical protein [Pseudoalteromonas luteoviolacea]|uniref:hypothetical protein n=1 Tax=Pseudoalteromonas luteoviolacea TaxID=43657 RepID=UPI001150E374|nr:hypothetical protein [Pseudoalteromonas luteoviolacea]TQF70491.1 hypothetical protein FLM44_05185 [Pseudoalteromonas luteoviolacea]